MSLTIYEIASRRLRSLRGYSCTSYLCISSYIYNLIKIISYCKRLRHKILVCFLCFTISLCFFSITGLTKIRRLSDLECAINTLTTWLLYCIIATVEVTAIWYDYQKHGKLLHFVIEVGEEIAPMCDTRFSLDPSCQISLSPYWPSGSRSPV